jgi:hypothetical protein
MNAHYADSKRSEDNDDDGPDCIGSGFFANAAKGQKRRITREMIRGFEAWRDSTEIRDA